MSTYEPCNQCTVKKAFPLYQVALLKAKRLWEEKRVVVFPYHCPQCGNYHNGRNETKRKVCEKRGCYYLSGENNVSVPLWWVDEQEDVSALAQAQGKEQ